MSSPTSGSILSLWIILNGALAQVIMASRVMFDLPDRRGGAPSLPGQVWERTSTPVPATLAGAGVALALALTLPLDRPDGRRQLGDLRRALSARESCWETGLAARPSPLAVVISGR